MKAEANTKAEAKAEAKEISIFLFLKRSFGRGSACAGLRHASHAPSVAEALEWE